MKRNSKTNKSGSGETWRSKRPAKSGSEKELLRRQALESKAAMVRTTRDLGNTLLGALNLRGWVQHYPLGTTGAAALTGFIMAGPIHLPKKKPAPASPAHDKIPEKNSREPSSLWPLLIDAGADVLKGVLAPVLTELLHSKKSGAETPDPAQKPEKS